MEKSFYFSTPTIEMRNIEFVLANTVNSESKKNWAFIDMQNVYKGVQERGWRIDWQNFRGYLANELNVINAIIFMGYIEENKNLYNSLEKSGFLLEFRKVKKLPDGTIDGGNVDADLAFYTSDKKNDYDKAIIIADDGDYCQMIKGLNLQSKLGKVISSHTIKRTSGFIKDVLLSEQIISIHSLRNIIEFKKAK